MILAILQARLSSTRLPGKVLKPILGRPMLEHQIERIRRSRLIDRLMLATSDDPSDKPLEQLCLRLNIACFRGSLNNVLDRFYQAAVTSKPEHVVRLTGDCPLADPKIIDSTIRHYLDGGFDYTSNALEATFPDGLDIEIFRFSVLETAWKEASLPSQKEHVTPFIYSQPERFKLGSFKGDKDLSGKRWTVDVPRDFQFVEKIYETLYPKKPDFDMYDILKLLEQNPELETINTDIERNLGYKKSLAEDKNYRK